MTGQFLTCSQLYSEQKNTQLSFWVIYGPFTRTEPKLLKITCTGAVDEKNCNNISWKIFNYVNLIIRQLCVYPFFRNTHGYKWPVSPLH